MSTSTSRAHYNIPSTRLQATIDESEPITHTKNMGEHELGTLIVVGSSNQDLTTYTESIPKLGQTVLGQRFEVSPGGKGANQGELAADGDLETDKERECTCNVQSVFFGLYINMNII